MNEYPVLQVSNYPFLGARFCVFLSSYRKKKTSPFSFLIIVVIKFLIPLMKPILFHSLMKERDPQLIDVTVFLFLFVFIHGCYKQTTKLLRKSRSHKFIKTSQLFHMNIYTSMQQYIYVSAIPSSFIVFLMQQVWALLF